MVSDLYQLVDGNADQGAPIRQIVKAAQSYCQPRIAKRHDFGGRISTHPNGEPGGAPKSTFHDIVYASKKSPISLFDAIHGLVCSSLSLTGYAKAQGYMKVNQFLGEVVNGRHVLNEKSYNFTIFGTPLENEPWGGSYSGSTSLSTVLLLLAK